MDPNQDSELLVGSDLLERPEVREARDFLLREDPWVLRVQKELTAIPAPPFEEGARGRRVAELFREVGLTRVRTDRVGNVLAELPQEGGSPPFPERAALIVSAHLDTVFPAGTDVVPRDEGEVIRAPGIADDGRGLAALVALARTLDQVPLSLPSPPLFVATVGEEGVGNLRGVRHLFQEGEAGSRAWAFISLDGAGLNRIIHQGVGSVRLRITAMWPGRRASPFPCNQGRP
jgi:acetylornithine deacetylase/succinyl-diaminopimelate desuccinylase-like protein